MSHPGAGAGELHRVLSMVAPGFLLPELLIAAGQRYLYVCKLWARLRGLTNHDDPFFVPRVHTRFWPAR